VRVVLFTGKGGVGKTTLAAATAAHIAADGRKTLVVSTDPAHSLADAMGCGTDSEPTEVSAGLFVGQVDTQRRLQESWGELQGYLASALGSAGVDRLRAEELTVLPGAEELLALIEVRDHVRSGRWDAVIVDCAPTAETLRLLALPEALDWYVSKALPADRRVVRALRPLLGPAVGMPMPNADVWAAAERLQAQLLDVQQVLQSPETTVRLVLTPESVVVAEARRAFTQLALYGYRVDGVLANRIFEDGDDPWRSGWAEAQRDLLAEVVESFDPLPIFTAAYLPAEPVGPDALASLGAAVYGEADPLAGVASPDFLQVRQDGDSFVMTLALPLLDKDSLDLTRVGDDLVVTVAGRRRVLALPGALRRCRVRGAHVAGDGLEIRFQPDPQQFPTSGGAHP
jgi:arsenite-transporting ATPase